MTYLYAIVAIAAITFLGYAKGTVDSRFGEAGFHTGAYWDGWHIWARAYLYVGCLGWMLPWAYPWTWNIVIIPVAGLTNFVAFRLAVYRAGKYEQWYGGRK
jgi:hypothetical protein